MRNSSQLRAAQNVSSDVLGLYRRGGGWEATEGGWWGRPKGRALPCSGKPHPAHGEPTTALDQVLTLLQRQPHILPAQMEGWQGGAGEYWGLPDIFKSNILRLQTLFLQSPIRGVRGPEKRQVA